MKKSLVILLLTFALLVMAMFITNSVLKSEYDKLDKSDIYWTYEKINEQPFKHLVIEGGNRTNIAFEPSKKSSVRVYKNWEGFDKKIVNAYVKNDTLYLKCPDPSLKNPAEKEWWSWNTLVRIFSPELLSVNGINTNIGLFKMKQKNYTIRMDGKSKLEVESYIHQLDTIRINAKDSSTVVFEISPDSLGTDANIKSQVKVKEPAMRQITIGKNGVLNVQSAAELIHSWEFLDIGSVDANVQGISLVDLGHAQIGSIHLNIADTSGIILSGQGLRNLQN